MKLFSRVSRGLRVVDPSMFALAFARCPFCGRSLFARLHAGEAGVRCLRCTASTIHLSLGLVLQRQVADLAALDVCELSARGPLSEHLRRVSRSYSGSEYFEDCASGSIRDGVRCEDVQRLSYADASFDLVVHTEVLEHVPDDARAWSELHRVLRPGGRMLFTVPLWGELTVERARLAPDGHVEHLLEPVYHADPQRRDSGILAFRDYGNDIVERLAEAGFVAISIESGAHAIPWLDAHAVVVARRAAA